MLVAVGEVRRIDLARVVRQKVCKVLLQLCKVNSQRARAGHTAVLNVVLQRLRLRS